MTNKLEYAPDGLLGVLTPQANTTVEPELMILIPPRTGMITARLTSSKPTIDERLVDYVEAMDSSLEQFANAPVGAVAFACTGAAYLVDPAEEDRHLAEIERNRGYPVITAANAVRDALEVLHVQRVGIISPYGDPLHENAMSYWEKRGLTIIREERINSAAAAFHPIYALGGEVSKGALEAIGTDGLEAVAMLGTGLPTLPTILRATSAPVPVISPNLCLAWRSLLALSGVAPSAANLEPWLSGSAWSERFRQHTGL
jgi:maleate cis-trans isomerase